MDCDKARRGVWPPERPKLVQDEVVEARRHIDGCDDCGEYFAQDRALLEAYDRIRAESAPREVRERVFDALSRARWTAGARALDERPRRILQAFLPVAVVAALAVVLVVEARRPEPVGEASMFVEDYLRRAVGQDHITTNDRAEVRRFLRRELGMQVEPLHLAGLDVTRAEICLLEGRRGAMIVYERNGAEVSHYLVPRDGAVARLPTLSASVGGDVDMPVVTWSTPRVEQALVGEVDSAELLQIARLGSS